MISPFLPDEEFYEEDAGPAFPDCTQQVEALLGREGRMAGVFTARGKTYEPRPQQLRMACAVAGAVAAGEHLVAEAGTGVGKSFAYLAPTLLAALEAGEKVVVSTYTISLQEQLLIHDLPRLAEALGRDVKAVMVKGRSNYLCKRRLRLARSMGGDLFRPEHQQWLDRLTEWANTTDGDGSRQSLPEPPPPEVWSQVCAEEGTCVYPAQREHHDCFLTKARARMQDADILIVNHALFFADLAMRHQGGGLLPEFNLAVLDEAHQMEEAAGQALGLRLTPWSFIRWIRSLYHPDSKKGLLTVLKRGDLAHEVGKLQRHVDRLFEQARAWAFARSDGKGTLRLTEPPDIDTPIPGMLQDLAVRLKEVELETENPEMKGELALARRRAGELATGLTGFLELREEGYVYWIEEDGRTGGKNRVVLCGSPVDVGPVLNDLLFDRMHCVVMTSATLAVDGKMAYFRRRVGAVKARELLVGSPFDYARQMRVYVPPGVPEPNQPGFADALGEQVKTHVRQTRGGTFVLFTSHAMLREVLRRVEKDLLNEGYPLWIQGRDVSRHHLVESFKGDSRSVLFGLSSFWTGVDVPGDALRSVMITRLPFAVPDHPLTQARTERITQTGGNAFKEYSLPDAVLRFKQGVGRLIRGQEDQGRIVILDPRIKSKWYGRWFVKAVPECPWIVEED